MPLAAATKASAIPVLPLVGSTISFPGPSRAAHGADAGGAVGAGGRGSAA